MYPQYYGQMPNGPFYPAQPRVPRVHPSVNTGELAYRLDRLENAVHELFFRVEELECRSRGRRRSRPYPY